MKNRSLTLIIICIFISIQSFSQGGYLGFTIGDPYNGMIGIRGGTTIRNIVEASALWNPKIPKWKNPGFAGAYIKLPLLYFPLIQNYESAFVMGTFLDYTGGVILLPGSSASGSTYKKTALGNAGGLGLEFMRLGRGISFSIPISLGYGRLQFNQQIADQIPDPQTGYTLQSTAFILMGIKIFLSTTNCDNYVEKLKNGN